MYVCMYVCITYSPITTWWICVRHCRCRLTPPLILIYLKNKISHKTIFGNRVCKHCKYVRIVRQKIIMKWIANMYVYMRKKTWKYKYICMYVLNVWRTSSLSSRNSLRALAAGLLGTPGNANTVSNRSTARLGCSSCRASPITRLAMNDDIGLPIPDLIGLPVAVEYRKRY